MQECLNDIRQSLYLHLNWFVRNHSLVINQQLTHIHQCSEYKT